MADIVTNHKARRDYFILETFEAGIVLHGTEVKSLRAGKGQIADAFARIEKNEAWLYNLHIDEYSHGNVHNHAPKVPRKLLLHKSEIRKLFELGSVNGKSFTWDFNSPDNISFVELNKIAPSGLLDHTVKTYIARNPLYQG